ncbi:MAG: GNAT family N-acetyltransferase [Candidatus Thiodiazotropha sp.]
MKVRELKKRDIEIASSICRKAFTTFVAPGLSSEGVEAFNKISSIGGFLHRMKAGNSILVCEEQRKIVGIVELKEGRHLAMLFVHPDHQKRGVGRVLISAILPYVTENTLTVSASLNSVSAYLKYGFTCSGVPEEKSGLKYQPMELKIK